MRDFESLLRAGLIVRVKPDRYRATEAGALEPPPPLAPAQSAPRPNHELGKRRERRRRW
jgi:hypothetical protein